MCKNRSKRKNDYVICERPLKVKMYIDMTKFSSLFAIRGENDEIYLRHQWQNDATPSNVGIQTLTLVLYRNENYVVRLYYSTV